MAKWIKPCGVGKTSCQHYYGQIVTNEQSQKKITQHRVSSVSANTHLEMFSEFRETYVDYVSLIICGLTKPGLLKNVTERRKCQWADTRRGKGPTSLNHGRHERVSSLVI